MEVTASDLARTYSVKTDEDLLVLHGLGTLTDIAYETLEAELAKRQIASRSSVGRLFSASRASLSA